MFLNFESVWIKNKQSVVKFYKTFIINLTNYLVQSVSYVHWFFIGFWVASNNHICFSRSPENGNTNNIDTSITNSNNEQETQNDGDGNENNGNIIIENKNERDITSAIVDHNGGILINNYWGVSLEIPENALPQGVTQEIYFVITDPRLCENSPPLDIENGTSVHTF